MRHRAVVIVLTGIFALIFSTSWTTAEEIPKEETQAVERRVSAVTLPDGAQLARALGVEAASQEPPADFLQNYLQDLGDLDGDSIPEYALDWTTEDTAAPTGAEDVMPAWALFLLNWDGARWHALPMMGGFEPFSLEVLPAMTPRERRIAVTVSAGAARIPYPVVFLFHAHAVAQEWDSRSDESRYEGYHQGKVQFGKTNGALQMISTGRADPGFLVFPKAGTRGFQARTVYDWQGNAFIPVKTEYTPNRDYTLYRFIIALHVHDFKTAYSLIEPARFLKKKKPTLAVFRKMVEDNFPEFLDDRIFRAQDSGTGGETFVLKMRDKVYVYTPSFAAGSRFLLTGLVRQEHKPEGE
jgi:hypothetical protein